MNKQQKLIIAIGAAIILLVVIVTTVICINDINKGKKTGETKVEETKDSGKNDSDKKEDKTDKNDKDESSKDDETSDDATSESESESSDESSGETESSDETTSDSVSDDTSKNDSTTDNSKDDEEETTKNNGSNSGNSGNTSNGNTSTSVNKTDFGVANPSGSLTSINGRISVHDPSIEYDPVTKKWYIFGSHKAFGQTSNLMTWSTVPSMWNSSTFHTVFAESAKWSAKGGTQGNASYKVDGNLWAPDIIYNKDMKKWCMYMSVNGDNHYSSIAMATADSITGPYTYQGTVVYSGFKTVAELKQTDYEKVTGKTTLPSYSSNWGYSGTNAIDPCVLYDEDGQLWMIYGSWFGGTYMLKLDNETGLRDYTYKITLDTSASDGTAADPYLGIRISGGYGGTGEGPYIVWDEEAGYYYLYLSYCGLNATDGFSGYQMRLFRSKNITGPYTDAAGHYANRKNSSDDQSVKGIKIMGNYSFSSLSGAPSSTNSQNGYRSPGHNSAFVDNENNRYLVYHTRFNVNAEWHEVRVHQQFLNEDGWLVTAPYEYAGSKLNEKGYSSSDIVGTYEYINHGNEVTFNVVAGMLTTQEVTLNADGTITGDVTGTWKQKSGTPYATMVIGGVTYKGVFFKQFDESSSHKEVMTFTLIGSNNLAIWGSKVEAEVAETGKMVGSYKFDDTSSLGKDSTGTVGNATVNGCATYSDSERGKVLSFDGSDDFVQLPANATKNMKGYTIMMWVKPTESTEWARVFDFGDGTADNMFFTLKAYGSGFRFAHKYNDASEKQITGDSALSTNKWTHIAVTISASSKKAILYVNGTRVGSAVLDTHLNSFAGTQNYLGKSQYPDPYFKGYMDNVYIFNYALSASEITTYMNK
ncbi:MAG: family 43 glycosylhydrolase [Lachnospiraceae bacterium]|nr:family 43 glycosylhydrolase [Lachnospiraceae bacterium]